MKQMNLNSYDLIIINSSAGKDSLCAIWEVHRMAIEQNFPLSQITISHQDLGDMEWDGTGELAKKQADFFGFNFVVTRRRDKSGYEENLLEYVERRKKWPSN